MSCEGSAGRRAPSFRREIQPILAEHCLKCHGEATRKADLDLRSPATIAKGGVSGPAIERGASSKSLLYEQISTHVMPPGKAAKLSAAQIARRSLDGSMRGRRVTSPRAKRRQWWLPCTGRFGRR